MRVLSPASDVETEPRLSGVTQRMNFKTTTYTFTFDSIRRTCGGREWLCFPGHYGVRRGPFKNREDAWAEYVRVIREVYFRDDPKKPIVDVQEVPIPTPYVPPTDYQI